MHLESFVWLPTTAKMLKGKGVGGGKDKEKNLKTLTTIPDDEHRRHQETLAFWFQWADHIFTHPEKQKGFPENNTALSHEDCRFEGGLPGTHTIYFFCFPGHLLHSSFPTGGFPSLLATMTLWTSAQVGQVEQRLQQPLTRGCCNQQTVNAYSISISFDGNAEASPGGSLRTI